MSPALTPDQVAFDEAIKARSNAPHVGIAENHFEVIVKGVDGRSIDDAVVSVVLTTTRLPARGWLYKKVNLTPSDNGTYVGAGTLPNAPKWETTIKVKKDGRKIGQRKLTLAAV